MKRPLFIILSLLHLFTEAQIKKWSNASGNGTWSTPNNWIPVGAPAFTDDVIFDNTFVPGSYVLDLPAGTTTTTMNTLTITPNPGNTIRIRLPPANTNQPGFAINSTTGDVIQINEGGIFENSSGAPSSPSISIPGIVRINNGGRYIHNTISTANAIVSHLSIVPGTELGVIEYAQGSNNSLLSSGITYNSIELSTTSTKAFSFSGNSPTYMRGFMKINTGVNFTSIKNGNINIAGDLTINGSFDYSPSSAGTIDRSLIFNGSVNQNLNGTGPFTQGINFRNFRIHEGSILTLLRNLNITSTSDSIIVDTSATLRMGVYIISGGGNFFTAPFSTLSIGSPAGINSAGNNSGNVQTLGSRTFDTLGIYEYYGIGAQQSGTGLPGSVKKLIINKTDFSSVLLTKNVNINDTISLQKGFLVTTLLALPMMRDTTAILSPPGVFSFLLGINNIGYKKSFINGPAAMKVNSTSAKWFPVGKIMGADTLFAPVKLSKFNNTPVIDTVEYFYSPHFDASNFAAPPLDHVSKVEYWNIQGSSGSPDNSDTITLSWRSQSRVGNGNPAYAAAAMNDLTISHYFDDDGTGPNPRRWNIDGSPTTFVANGNVNDGMIKTTIPSAATSSYTLGTRSPYNILPLRLITFDVHQTISGANLVWTTGQEKGIKKFMIQKSLNGVDFDEIGGTPVVPCLVNSYQFLDQFICNGWNFYRLRIIDEGNRPYFSRIIKIWGVNKRTMEIYPNPAEKEISVHFIVPSSAYSVEIVNTRGQVIFTRKTKDSLIKINIESLSRGVYVLRARNQLQHFSQSFMKH